MIKQDFLKNYTELISSGSTPKGGSDVYLNEGDILFIRSQNVLMNKFSDHSALYLPQDIHEKMNRTWVKNGDVLLNITGASIGRTTVYQGEDNKANVNQHVCLIRSKDFKTLDPFYLSYFISSPAFQKHIMRINAGATRQALNFSQIAKFKIPILTIDCQRKIVKSLEMARKLKEWRVEADRLTDEYLKSVFLEMFGDPLSNPKGWDEEKIINLCMTGSGGTPSRSKKEYYGGQIPWVKSGELNKKIIYDTEEKITDLGIKNSSAKLLNPETVLIAMYGATVGKTAILKIKASTNQAVCSVEPKDNRINKIFLLNCLKSLSKYLINHSVGVGQPNISQKIIKETKIPTPPIDLQNQFADIVQKVETIKPQQKESNVQIDNLFDALMQKAFKGELSC